MKIFKIVFLVIVYVLFSTDLFAAAPQKKLKEINTKESKNEKTVESQIGLKIPDWGIAIDAVYNPELTGIIPGYHIVNVVLTNYRDEIINLDVKKDKWVVIDSTGKRHVAYNHVREFNKDLWAKLPQKLQNLLDYPQAVSPGKASTIDILLPESVDLFHFSEVSWKSEHFNKEFNMLTNYEKNLNVPTNNKEIDINQNDTKTNLEAEDQPDSNHDTVNYPSKYQTSPKIGEVEEPDSQNPYPTFDPSLDDTIIIRE